MGKPHRHLAGLGSGGLDCGTKEAAISDSIVAVLTGDIVGSSKLGANKLDNLVESLGTAAERLADWPGNAGSHGFARSRGDTWQLVLTAPELALRACLFLRAAIKSVDRHFDTRIGVGIGGVDYFDPNDVGASDGEAFRLSGMRLDDRTGHARFRIGVEGMDQSEELFSALFALCDRISQEWTAAQAEVSYFLFEPQNADLSQEQIGDLLSPAVTQQQVGKAFLQAGGPALQKAVHAFEAWDWQAGWIRLS
jgi:hypothetical protein